MVDEQIQTETKEAEKQNPAENSNIGVSTEEESPIDKANKAAERLEKANTEQAKLIAKQEKLLAEAKLSGRSIGGSAKTEPTLKDRALEFWKGTPIADAIKQYG